MAKKANEKMFNITNYQRNANQNHNKVSFHSSQNGHHLKNLQTINAKDGMQKRDPLSLLVGIYIGTATMQNSMEVL